MDGRLKNPDKLSDSEIEHALKQTLADNHLSRNERQAFNAVLKQLDPDGRRRAEFRRSAFQVACEELIDPHTRAIVGWLEDVVKVLQPESGSREVQARAYFSPGDKCPRAIVDLLNRTASSIDICVFTISDNRLARAIVKAHCRGVVVRVITDDLKREDEGSDIERLERAGIDVRQDSSEDHMHHKFALFDRKTLLTGSYNWTRTAAEHNMENFVVTDHPRLVQAYADEFERLWLEFG